MFFSKCWQSGYLYLFVSGTSVFTRLILRYRCDRAILEAYLVELERSITDIQVFISRLCERDDVIGIRPGSVMPVEHHDLVLNTGI